MWSLITGNLEDCLLLSVWAEDCYKECETVATERALATYGAVQCSFDWLIDELSDVAEWVFSSSGRHPCCYCCCRCARSQWNASWRSGWCTPVRRSHVDHGARRTQSTRSRRRPFLSSSCLQLSHATRLYLFLPRDAMIARYMLLPCVCLSMSQAGVDQIASLSSRI